MRFLVQKRQKVYVGTIFLIMQSPVLAEIHSVNLVRIEALLSIVYFQYHIKDSTSRLIHLLSLILDFQQSPHNHLIQRMDL